MTQKEKSSIDRRDKALIDEATRIYNEDAKRYNDSLSKEDRLRNAIIENGFKRPENKSIPVIRKVEDNSGFLQKGAFDDGYQFGDVTGAVLGTAGDIGLGAVKGVSGMVEGLTDLGRYGLAGAADFVGADDYAEKVRNTAKQNTVEELFKPAEEYLDNYSVLGDTGTNVAEGLGQVGGLMLIGGGGAAAGLGKLGNTLLTIGTMGASSVGSGMSEAYNKGATDSEAVKYGIAKGAIDAGTEMLFGGLGKAAKAIGLSKGISSLDDAFALKLSERINNQFAKNLVELGVKSSAEGAEEVLAGIGTAVAQKLTYMDEKDLKELVEDQDLLEQFVVGAVTSGISQSGLLPGTKSGSFIEANKSGTDFITGYTPAEQATIDKVVAERVAEQQKNGSRLSKKGIGKIEESVKASFDRGEIAEPTAESAQMPLEPLSAQQETNTMPNNESALNSQIQGGSETVSEVATPINYNTKTINGFDDVSKEMNKLIGMYGNDSIKAMHSQVNSLINEYMATNDTSKFHEAMEIASEIDRQLLGKTYKYKANRKGVKGENARREVAYTPDSYIDTLYSEVRGYQDVARENATNNVVPDLANVDTFNQYASTENIQSDNQRVRSYNTTLIEKTDAPQELKNEFIENPQIYTQLSNKATLDFAMDILNNNDLNTAIVEYRKMLDAKNPTAIPLGYNISKQLVADGRLDESVQVIRDMSKALTESGQFSQAAAITLMNNDPEAAKRYLIREIDNLNKKGEEKFGKKWTDFELTENELEKFDSIKPGDVDAIKQAYQDVYNRIQKEYPSTFKEKLMEYRRVAMLLNVRTNIRNVVSNAMLSPVRWTADRVSALGEGVYSLINPNYQRTQSANPFTSKKTKKLANEVFEANKDVLLGENKYDDAGEALRDKQVFKGTKVSNALDTAFNGAITKANQAMGKDINPSLMETARNLTYYLLQKGDDVFVKKNFVSRLSSYLDAQGITDIADVPPDAITLATQEAMKATFKDDSAFSKGLGEFRKMLNKAPGGMLGDIVMPFTKTPANLAMRGIDYSPVGVINGIKTLRNATTNEDVARGITQLGQAATGTAGILLGYLLAESGWIVGGLSDDKDEAQFQKQQGKLAYSIKTPWGDYITYDWAQPASIPLILGSTIYDSLNEDVSLTSGLKQGGLAVADSWLELSPLQNLSDIFGGYGTPAENVLDVLATDFPLSFIPAQLGAIARTGDNTQRTTYSNDYLENLKNQAMAKIPGLSQQLPTTYDTWGREVQRYDNLTEGLIANMLNPGQLGNESVTPLDDEILELYESTGNAAVFPKKAGWTENKQKLSAEEYSEFQRISGSNSYDMVEALIYSPSYSLLDDEQKVEIISDIYNFSNALADKEVTNYDIESSKTYGKAYAVYEEEGAEGVANFYAIKKLKAGDKQSEIVSAIEQMDLSDDEKGYYLSLFVEPNKETVKLYNSENWDAFYDYYFEKTAKDRKASSYNELDPLFSY